MLSWNAFQVWNASNEGSWQQRDERRHASIEHLSKRDANAGGWTLDRMLTWMGCSPYANQLSEVVSCVFEPFVTFAFRENYLAHYVQKLR